MTTQADSRDVQFIPQSADGYRFQDMCLHVYEEVYHSSCMYGRHGQAQYGLDILLNDYRTAPINKHKGIVFIQCKHTVKHELAFSALKNDVLAARDKVMTSVGYDGVYLYIVATNAKNDAGLHDSLQSLKSQENLPFEIELHTWDKLCSIIRKSDKLWELYNNRPGEGVDVGVRYQVHQMTHDIGRLLQRRLLADAWTYDLQRRGLRPKTGYGQHATPVPDDVWKKSPPLRKVLLELYGQASDASGAYPLLEYEFSLSDMQSADSCLAYLQAARIVENLRSPGRSFLTVNDTPRFTSCLEGLAEKICEMPGSPEKLACLALMLIMESSNSDIQDAALRMMARLKDRDIGTQWEHTTCIAHAIVRHYYVVRRGWTPMARYYTLGDTLGLGHWIDLDDELLGKSFNLDECVRLRIATIDPLDTPRYGCGRARAIKKLSQLISGHSLPIALPQLEAECHIYSSEDYESGMPTWPESKNQLSDQRVVDFPTLARAAANDAQWRLLEHYAPLITERTFERLLGYRAYLRAYVERVGEPADKYAKKLQTIESLIGACRYPDNIHNLARGTVWVMPVYDNPPRRLGDKLADSGFNRTPFTLSDERLDYWSERVTDPSWASKWREELEKRYVDRNDEFSLSCLLALHRHNSMLTYSYLHSSLAAQMGIAADYPHPLERVC